MGRELFELINAPSSYKFFEKKWESVFPVKDLLMCVDYDIFPFILKVKRLTNDVFEISKELL